MKKIDKVERAKVVAAMDKIARCINVEDIIMDLWLPIGVADGDITDETTPEEIIELGYCDDEAFQETMETFLNCMWHASKCGGLYCDYIATRNKY